VGSDLERGLRGAERRVHQDLKRSLEAAARQWNGANPP
jgi:hypothetical protein